MENLESYPTLWFDGNSYQFSAGKYNVKCPVFLKKMAVTSSSLKFEREVKTFLEANNTHENIVRFYGSGDVSGDGDEKKKLIIIELCICSLADLYEPERRRAWMDHQNQFIGENIPVAFDATKAPDQVLNVICSWLENAVNKKSVLRQATEAVAFLHSLSIIHRNLKPSNFLITKVNDEYVIKLTDMHFSKNIEKEPNNSKPELEWLAPESMGEMLTLKTDVFVLGCVYYYVFSKGKHPFDSEGKKPTRSDRESNILDYNHVAIDKWPAILGEDAPFDLIEKMISEDPDDRSTAEDLLLAEYFTPEGEYALSGKTGLCVIFNQKFPKQGETVEAAIIDAGYERKGTDQDCDSLMETFATLGFDVRIREDVDGGVLVSDVEDIGKKWDAQYKSLVVCILSHGQKDKVLGDDMKPVDINRLKYALNSTDCPLMNGIPKVFIIQACQGYLIAHEAASAATPSGSGADQESTPTEDEQRLHSTDKKTGTSSSLPPESGVQQSKSKKPSSDRPKDDKTHFPQRSADKNFLLYPPVLDILSLMSTVPEFVSIRIYEEGTWRGSYFIQELCKQIDNRPAQSNLADIFPRVVTEVCSRDITVWETKMDLRYAQCAEARRDGTNWYFRVKQVPEMRSSLRKRFRLLDGQSSGQVWIVKDTGELMELEGGEGSYLQYRMSQAF